MPNILKRSMALLVALVLCLSLLPAPQVSAASANVEYVYDSTGKYIYNWGTRETVATFLSPNAEAFYTGSNSYDVLSALAGGTGTSDAPDSPLYDALQDLMAGAHKTKPSYNATRSLYQYTDCQNSGGKISSFYSGLAIGPTWDGSFNREHTWPNSKGLGGDDEDDIMMLRPTSTTENSARGNTAYGESAGYYHPNSESDGKHDLRGDVARIFLYVYVRWGNVNGNGQYSTWGSRGVMESLDVLLKWMEQDPVDTWELGRNDSVQSITGTRNVFVDYPEFAFLLFGEEVPAQMATPSGASTGGCQHNYVAGTTVAATCTTDGYTVYTCSLCQKSYNGDKVAAGHNYVGGTCTVCGLGEFAVIDNPVVGTPYKFGMVQPNVSSTDVYYITGSMNSYYMDTTMDKSASPDVYLENASGGYYLYTTMNGVKTYINMVVSGTHVNGQYSATATTVYTYDTANKTLISQVNGEPYWFGTRNDKTYTTVGPCATSYNGFVCHFYGEISQGEEPTPGCQHSNTTIVDAKAATCTENGHTGKTVCNDCGQTINYGSTTSPNGHSYANGACTVCGAAKPTSETVTISFASDAQRIEFAADKQVWVQNGITITNQKASSTSNMGNYINPVRFYSGTSVTVEYPGMTTIEFTCSTTTSANVLKESIGSAATISGSKVTVTFDAPQDSFEVAKLNAQVRVSSIAVTASAASSTACQHNNVTTGSAKAATCTESGYTAEKVCDDCKVVLVSSQTINALGHDLTKHAAKTPTCTAIGWAAYETCSRCSHTTYAAIPATGHSYNAVVTAPTCTVDGCTTHTCSGCGDSYITDKVTAPGHNPVQHDEKAPTCTENGYKNATICSNCNEVLVASETIDALGHDLIQHEAKTPTCSEIGWAAYETCSRCSHTTYAEIPTTEHNYKSVISVPTCTEEGCTTHTCSVCGSSYTSDKVAALGHNPSKIEQTTPTCTEAGRTIHTCSVCNESYEVAKTDALGHKLVHVAAKAATADAEGNIEYWHCETCKGVWTDEACTQSTTLDKVVLPKLDSAPAGNGGLLILIGSLAAVAVVAVVGILLIKKKRSAAK